MTQELGETRDAIIKDDNKMISDILNTNKNVMDPYWIVVFAKQCKVLVEGKPALIKHIKAYRQKPTSQVGMIIGEVDNSRGSIKWEVNMPQIPFDFDALRVYGVKETSGTVVETTTIPGAYLVK